jgi:DNA-directed RNA polymerase specialized sigma subunit
LESAGDLTTADPTPEQQAAIHQKVALMKQVLTKMSDREFEVLNRFYLREQPPERIRMDMGLTQTQFNLLKSRAKAKLTEFMQRRLAQNHSIENDNDRLLG